MKETIGKYAVSIMFVLSYGHIMRKLCHFTAIEIFLTAIPLCTVVLMIVEIYIKSAKEGK
jgi:hypothetical protein